MGLFVELVTSFWGSSITVKFISVLICLIIHINVKNYLFKRKYKLPPGPRAWPILGNLPEIVRTTPWDYFNHLHQTYGDVVLCQLGMVPTVVVNRLQFLIEAFVTKDNDFSGRTPIPSFSALVCDGKDIIMAPRITPQWTAQRMLLHKVIRNFIGGEIFQKCIEDATERFFKLMDSKTEAEYPGKDIARMMINMIYGLLYGEDFEYVDPLFVVLEKQHHQVHEAILPGFLESMFPFAKYSPYLPGRNVLKECGAYNYRSFEARINQKLKDDSWVDGESLIDHLIKLMKRSQEKEGYKLQVPDLIAVLVDFELAATDTTEFTLIWTILLVLKNDGIQEMIHEELENVLGDRPILLEEFDRERLPYLMAVVRESMRLRSILYHYLPHVTTCDTQLGGFDIPEGTNIVINVDSIHHDKDAWPDPGAFKPERFLGDGGKLLPKPDHFVPFSAGRRVCAGEVMGKQMVTYLLARILQRYKIEAGPGEILDIEPTPLGAIRVPNPFKVSFKRI